MVRISHASISENGTVNGQPGDQTGREVCIRDWYCKPWTCVIRFNDPVFRERVAYDMEAAAVNCHIGYGQGSRNQVLEEGRKTGYDVGKITKDVNCDCSSLVSVACIYAGVHESMLYNYGNCATTRTIRKALESTGLVTVYTSDDYTKRSDKLIRGDILLAEGSHVATVIEGNEGSNHKAVDVEIVSSVLSGKLGNGDARKEKIKAAGYSVEEVQRKVNEILTYSGTIFNMKKHLKEYWDLAVEYAK